MLLFFHWRKPDDNATKTGIKHHRHQKFSKPWSRSWCWSVHEPIMFAKRKSFRWSKIIIYDHHHRSLLFAKFMVAKLQLDHDPFRVFLIFLQVFLIAARKKIHFFFVVFFVEKFKFLFFQHRKTNKIWLISFIKFLFSKKKFFKEKTPLTHTHTTQIR